jgi:uncharacterized protein
MTPRPDGGVPRLVPQEPFPPYAYVSGHFPHPVSDPAGHSHGMPREQLAPLDPGRWQECRPYLRGLDLFNHGYYWEAHEVWEGLWHACGRTGTLAAFLKGLIKLAAAGVKAREGRPEGVRSHARRAGNLLRAVCEQLEPGAPRYCGLALDELIGRADDLADHPETARGDPGKPVEVVFRFALIPRPG